MIPIYEGISIYWKSRLLWQIKIVFVILFPVVYREIFIYLYYITTRNLSTIVPKHSLLIMNTDFYLYISVPYVNLHPNYYCTDGNLVEWLQDENFVFQPSQLRTNRTSCYSVPVYVKRKFSNRSMKLTYYYPAQSNKDRNIIFRNRFNNAIHLRYNCRFGTHNQLFINEKVFWRADLSTPNKTSQDESHWEFFLNSYPGNSAGQDTRNTEGRNMEGRSYIRTHYTALRCELIAQLGQYPSSTICKIIKFTSVYFFCLLHCITF